MFPIWGSFCRISINTFPWVETQEGVISRQHMYILKLVKNDRNFSKVVVSVQTFTAMCSCCYTISDTQHRFKSVSPSVGCSLYLILVLMNIFLIFKEFMLTGHLYTLFPDVFVQEYCPYFYWIVFYLSIFLIVLSSFYSQLYFFSFYFHSHYTIQTCIFLRWLPLKIIILKPILSMELLQNSQQKEKAARPEEIVLRLRCGLKYNNMFCNPCKWVCKVLNQCCHRLFHQSQALTTIRWGGKIPEAKLEARFSKRISLSGGKIIRFGKLY